MREPTESRVLKVGQKNIDKFFKGFEKRSVLSSLEISVLRRHLKGKPSIMQNHLYIDRFFLFCKSRMIEAKVYLNGRLEKDRRFVNTKLRLLKWENDAKTVIDIYDRLQEMKEYLKPYEFKAEIEESLWKR